MSSIGEASEWREIKTEGSQVCYFNKTVIQIRLKLLQTGILVYEKPAALRATERGGNEQVPRGDSSFSTGTNQYSQHQSYVKNEVPLTGQGAVTSRDG